jgi:cytochrome c
MSICVMILERTICASLVAVLLLAIGPPARAQDAHAGERIFRSQCSICHSAQPGRTVVGPSLFGVVGRHSGSVPGFHYSEANRRSGLTWDPLTLDRYLTKPQQLVPGTLMTFPGLHDPAQRADVIAFLNRLH